MADQKIAIVKVEKTHIIKAISLHGSKHVPLRCVSADDVEEVVENDGGGLAARMVHRRERVPLAGRRVVAEQVPRVAAVRVRAAAYYVNETWS